MKFINHKEHKEGTKYAKKKNNISGLCDLSASLCVPIVIGICGYWNSSCQIPLMKVCSYNLRIQIP